ncbi:MAG: MBL fold metallo-hydrolase [Firmicutes bacterium]|nr:MBL fold metallo-hydrolase [Bacillota bacterium]
MSRKSALWVLVIVLIAAVWFSYRAGPEKRLSTEHDGNTLVEEDFNVQERGDEEVAGDIKLEYLGHSAFLLEAEGFRCLMDPYSPQVGYGTLEVEADVVTISHEHMDHNYAAAASEAKVLRGLTPDGLGWEDIAFSEGKISIFGLSTYHDSASGKLRGRNMAFVFDIGDVRLVHLGDLGHILGESDVEKLSPVDVLLVPVGGHYTIDAAEAKEVVQQLSPSVVIPMHYQTSTTQNWPIETVKTFLEGENVREKESRVLISRNSLPEEREIWVLERKE